MSEAIIEKVRQFAESHFADDGSGHDWWHVHRVWNTAKHLADAEGADRTIVEIAALLHDVADWKLNEDESQGLNTIRELLAGDLPPETIDRICDIISKSVLQRRRGRYADGVVGGSGGAGCRPAGRAGRGGDRPHIRVWRQPGTADSSPGPAAADARQF